MHTVHIDSIEDLAREMTDPRGNLVFEHSDIIFVLPMAINLTEKHEIEQVEAVVRHRLGATVTNIAELKGAIAQYRIAQNHLEPPGYSLNYTELIAVPATLFDDLQARYVADELSTLHQIDQLLHSPDLPFAESITLNFHVTDGTNAVVATIPVNVREPLHRSLKQPE